MLQSHPLKAAIGNVPPMTKALVSILATVSFACFIYTLRLSSNVTDSDDNVFLGCSFIGLLPGHAFYTPWTIVTAAFYESNLFTLIFSSVVLLFCGKYLERAWGGKELLIYVLICATVSNIVTWFGLVMTFYLTGDSIFLYNTQVNGMAGVFSAFLVAFKHLIPEHRISLFGNKIAIRVKNLIGVATASSIIGLVLFQAIVFYNLVNIGWVVGWVYIRFFKYQDGVRGDHSETFALVTFFPGFLHPIIGWVSTTVYDILVKLRCCTPAQRAFAYDLENQSGTRSSASPMPGSARAEAERRRALALKVLDRRLSGNPVAPDSIGTDPSLAVVESTTSRSAAPNLEKTPLSTGDTGSTILFEAEKEQIKDVTSSGADTTAKLD